MDPDIKNQLDDLRRQLADIKTKRIYQLDITPGAVKARHISEGVPYIMSGLASKRPLKGAVVTQGVSLWFSTDSHVLSLWDGIQWRTVTLT